MIVKLTYRLGRESDQWTVQEESLMLHSKLCSVLKERSQTYERDCIGVRKELAGACLIDDVYKIRVPTNGSTNSGVGRLSSTSSLTST